MSIPLRIIERPHSAGYSGVIRHASFRPELAPGDMWREPSLDAAGREAWMIVLPGGYVWCTTDKGWTVNGTAPAVTVYPSINVHGYWHGWITDGQLVG